MAHTLPFVGDSFHSEKTPVSLMARLFPGVVFYAKMIALYVHAGKRAKAGYSGTKWAEDSLVCIDHLESVGGHFDVDGMDNFKHFEGPCVFAGNHMSTLETICLPCLIQPFKDTTFVVKKSLYNYPYFRDILIARDAVCVERKSIREDLKTMLEEGERHLKAGQSIIVFPQGARYPVFNPSDFNSIAVKLAKKAGVPIVPFALWSQAWGIGKILHDFGKITPSIPVRIRFGAPIAVEGTGKEAQRELLEFITGTLKGWNPAYVASESAE